MQLIDSEKFVKNLRNSLFFVDFVNSSFFNTCQKTRKN